MTSSLIPEKPLLVSPSLAATIGLEEATMLSLLSELAHYRQVPAGQWLELDGSQVQTLMPFWNELDVQRISKSLRDKGIILLGSAPYRESRRLKLAFNEEPPPAPASRRQTAKPGRKAGVKPGYSGTANLIPANWQPDRELWRQIAQYSIPEDFVLRQLPEFITYWRERGGSGHSWGAKFLQRLVEQWRKHETDIARREQETRVHGDWRPSDDAMEILTRQSNISLAFIEDAIPEFVLYWRERGDTGRTWNSKFIQHVKRQWLRYNAALEHDTEPRPIAENWQPSADVYDVLKLANIDLEFARAQVPEFVLYWKDSNRLHSSWNTKFLQHVKYHWARRHALTDEPSQQALSHAGRQKADRAGGTRDRSLIDDLTDRSWAS